MELEELKRIVAESGAAWEATETSLASYEPDPEQMWMLGYVPGPEEPSLEEQEQAAKEAATTAVFAVGAPSYPESFDWRDANGDFVTPIRNQGACGSCVAFGTCATVEGTARAERRDGELPVDLSEAHLFYCIARRQGRRCGGASMGWWPAPALDAFRDEGVADEACYPYVAGDQDCTGLCADASSRLATIGSWQELDYPADMKAWIAERGPVVGTMKVYEDFYRLYAGGVYRYTAGADIGGHCICIIGYDDRRRCWIGKNSWGTGWGESGFFEIGYGECGIDSSMWGVQGVRLPS